MNIKKFVKKNYLYIAFFIILVIFHLFIDLNLNDDIFFKEQHNIFNFLISRYNTWTSRLIIETSLVSILHFPNIVWSVLDSFMILLIVYSIDNLFVNDKKKSIFITLIIPFFYMQSAGYAATTLNYLWPLGMMLFSLSVLKDSYSEKGNIVLMLLSIFSILFACNQEQVCFIMIIVYIPCLIYNIKKKQVNKYHIICCIIILLSLIFILTTPGNNLRSISEMNALYPKYKNFNIFDKSFLALNSTVITQLVNLNVPLILFSVLLVFNKYKNKIYRIISVIPIGLIVIFNAFKILNRLNISIFHNLYSSMVIFADKVNIINYFGGSFLISTLISIIFLITIFLLVCNIENKKNKFIITVMLAIGYLSRFMMGLSPTIYASGIRTFFYLDVSFIISSYYLMNSINSKFITKYKNYVLMIFAIISTILNLYRIF